MYVCGVNGGRGGGGAGVTGVILVRVYGCASQYFNIHIPGLWKNGSIHILDRPKWPIHIHPFDFYTALKNIAVSSLNSKRISSLEKSLRKNFIRIYRDVRKVGPFAYESRKIRSVIYFLLKRGLKRGVGGGHSARTSVLCHIQGSYPTRGLNMGFHIFTKKCFIMARLELIQRCCATWKNLLTRIIFFNKARRNKNK